MYVNIGSMGLNITKNQAAFGSHQGDCDETIKQLSEVPAIKRQLSKIDKAALKAALKEYGAWDEEELNNHEQNKQRVLWMACGDINDKIIKN